MDHIKNAHLSAGTGPLPQVTVCLALVEGTEFCSGLALALLT